jgi:hypothetical protein
MKIETEMTALESQQYLDAIAQQNKLWEGLMRLPNAKIHLQNFWKHAEASWTATVTMSKLIEAFEQYLAFEVKN